jgi:DNA adenine methylase
MKPIVKWSGGKYREIKNFKEFYPKFEVFVEPFIGGGSVFFDMNFSGKNVISDVHEDLINFYKQINLGNILKIHEIVKKWKNEEDFYYYIRDEFLPKDDIEKAAVFFYQRKTCFRGMLRYNKSGKFNIPFGKYKSYDVSILEDIRYESLLKRTEIYLSSFEKIFEKYNDESIFFFIDPPYDSTFTDYGYCSFDRENHIKLANCFKKTKSKCLMIIGDSSLIKEIYDGYIFGFYDKKYAFKIYGGRVGSEIDNKHLIIKNY